MASPNPPEISVEAARAMRIAFVVAMIPAGMLLEARHAGAFEGFLAALPFGRSLKDTSAP